MIKDGQEFRVIEENCWSPEARLADMDKTGSLDQTVAVFTALSECFLSIQESLCKCCPLSRSCSATG